jgi:hypothetical protein
MGKTKNGQTYERPGFNLLNLKRGDLSMTYPKAIVIAAGLLAGAVVLSGPAVTHDGGERFAIASGGATAGAEGAWRVDTYTGRMVWCHTATRKAAAEGLTVLRGSGGRRVVCYDRDGKVEERL